MMNQAKAKVNTGKQSTLTMFSVWIPSSLKKRLDLHKAHKRVSLQSFAAEALAEKLDREKREAAA